MLMKSAAARYIMKAKSVAAPKPYQLTMLTHSKTRGTVDCYGGKFFILRYTNKFQGSPQ